MSLKLKTLKKYLYINKEYYIVGQIEFLNELYSRRILCYIFHLLNSRYIQILLNKITFLQ